MPQRDRPSGYVIGMARLVNNAPQHLRAEIGDVWLTPAFRGTYGGVECGQLLLRYLFETLGYVRTVCVWASKKRSGPCHSSFLFFDHQSHTHPHKHTHACACCRYRRVEWRCDTDNYGAKKTAERLGFTAEGVLHKHMVWREANRDTALYAMTNADWREGAADHLAALVARRCQDVAGLDKVGEADKEAVALAAGEVIVQKLSVVDNKKGSNSKKDK